MEFNHNDFADLSIEEMEQRILAKEPSISSLGKRAQLTARMMIALISRIHLVKIASRDCEVINSEFNSLIRRQASIAQDIEKIVFNQTHKEVSNG